MYHSTTEREPKISTRRVRNFSTFGKREGGRKVALIWGIHEYSFLRMKWVYGVLVFGCLWGRRQLYSRYSLLTSLSQQLIVFVWQMKVFSLNSSVFFHRDAPLVVGNETRLLKSQNPYVWGWDKIECHDPIF